MSSNLRQHARRLRRHHTDVERKLWERLRARQVLGFKFRRQHPIGDFIVDFCCVEKKLVIELDGSQHAWDVEADSKRSRALVAKGYRVLRFWNNELIENMDGVMERIVDRVQNPHPDSLP